MLVTAPFAAIALADLCGLQARSGAGPPGAFRSELITGVARAVLLELFLERRESSFPVWGGERGGGGWRGQRSRPSQAANNFCQAPGGAVMSPIDTAEGKIRAPAQ
ncbi:hypothetical protein SKAU_G00229140 [Synaphobranchus kaupii]|uniref:Secreted protein n=1 Tax=Synaphobranchus kaupii TaxID=118154 RepID=A0A9Q1F5A6_SYNKA|nr:hypothetical protein SKAU_G00229140 [Synaphobranchus kaupii]